MKYKVTYKNHNILFGNDIFSMIVEAENENDARAQIMMRGYTVTILSVERV